MKLKMIAIELYHQACDTRQECLLEFTVDSENLWVIWLTRSTHGATTGNHRQQLNDMHRSCKVMSLSTQRSLTGVILMLIP